jgi:hypothetical protein
MVSAPSRNQVRRSRVLRRFSEASGNQPRDTATGDHPFGLVVRVQEDLNAKAQAMADIARRLFVSDASKPDFESTQRWIVACGQQVQLPLNFCGGLLIMRLYRLLASPAE